MGSEAGSALAMCWRSLCVGSSVQRWRLLDAGVDAGASPHKGPKINHPTITHTIREPTSYMQELCKYCTGSGFSFRNVRADNYEPWRPSIILIVVGVGVGEAHCR